MNYTKQEMQELRDQYAEEMNERARKFCEMFVAIGCAVVSVDGDGRATRHSTPDRDNAMAGRPTDTTLPI